MLANRLLAGFTLLVCLLFVQCKVTKTVKTSAFTATITQEGFINCFEANLTTNKVPIWCEASAILYDGKKLFFANDKDMPDNRSSVFYWAYKNDFTDTANSATYSTNTLIKKGKKFEDFALTPNSKYAFLSTGFDRIKPGSTEWDSYNTILYWKAGDENHPKVLSINGTDSTSVNYREKISKVLSSPDFPKGVPYFKIEGFAATNTMLYWGVREEGKKYDDFKYKIKILTTPYEVKDDKIIVGDFKVLADFDIPSIRPVNQPIAISSIEYDRYNKRFLILTSYEEKESFGGYLWTATQSELENNKINLVKDSTGAPLVFHHKSEDLAIINKHKIIVIHDDDRVKTRVGNEVRQPNQAAYSIVEFK